jgi:hypothetical protein
VNCGGALGQADVQCPWCDAAPALVDVARLARALDPEGATAAHAVHATTAASTALSLRRLRRSTARRRRLAVRPVRGHAHGAGPG